MKAHCLPFSEIPHTTRLFADFLQHAPSVQPFYPRSPQFSAWVKDEAAKVSYDPVRRARVVDILTRQNKEIGRGEKTFANLDRLRRGASVIVTGQQVGLFGGPAFSTYKALTAVKLAEEATAAGVDTVPIFWLATYDHDLAEVNHVSLPAADGALQAIATTSHAAKDSPVAAVRFADEITPVVEQAASLLGDAEATQFLRDSYKPGETMGTAFARLFARVFAGWGVILLDASDPDLARVAAPIYRAAVERAADLSAALLARGKALEAAGYHQQVKVTESSVLLFVERDGVRTPIRRRSSGEFIVGESPAPVSASDLVAEISAHPERFSPSVLLRPIVEDYLLPTIAYAGGAAEIAYFGQAGVVYEALLGRITPVLPRFSATIVEPKTQRLLDRYSASLTAAFAGPEALRRQLAAHTLPADLQSALDAAKNSIDSSFATVKQNLELLDRTLVDAAETARSKMQHQLEKLQAQAARAESQKSELITRHADALSHALYPAKGLQERSIGGIYFLARYGSSFLNELYAAMHTDCPDHQIIEL